MKQVQKGFTLIELMIVVAIIGILAAVAIPAYSNYTKKAKFTEVVQATQAIKTGIEACQADMGDMGYCAAGSNGVPSAIDGAMTEGSYDAGTYGTVTPATGAATVNFGKYVNYVVTIPTDSTHISIVAGAAAANGLEGQYIRLDGAYTSGRGVEWTVNSGSSCVTANICKR